jgi:membrane protein DedA with SNARE-associated domain
MQDLIATLQANAPWAVFLNVMLNQGGLPLPALPTIVTAAALSAQQPNQLAAVLLAGISGALLGDLIQYWCGRRFGRRILALVCRISFSPDFCVSQTQSLLAKVGPLSSYSPNSCRASRSFRSPWRASPVCLYRFSSCWMGLERCCS